MVASEQLEVLIQDYRAELGLPAVPRSPSLDLVAQMHLSDLASNAPHDGPGCNLHSWSDAGSWSPCCFRGASEMECMMNKPEELTGYASRGFEIAVRVSTGVTPQHALELWQGSPGHDAVIVNRNDWSTVEWNAMGVAIDGDFAVVWFGEQLDTY